MILHLTRDFPPRRSGGLSTAVGGIVAGLARVGVASRVISFDGWGRRGPAANDALPAPATSSSVFRARNKGDAEAATEWAQLLPPAIVHVHDPFLWELGSQIAESWAAARVHTTHVLSHRQDQIRGLDTPTKTTTGQALALEQADAIIAPSPSTEALLRTEFPSLGARLRTARLGVEVAARPSDKTRELLFFGRYSDLAGIAELVTVIENLVAGTSLTVVGGLPDNQRAEKRWNEALAAAAADSRVNLELCGWLLGDELEQVVGSARVVVAPNRFASFGLAAAEAMALGLSVCAYRVAGLVDLIENGVSGRLVVEDPEQLAGVCLELLTTRGGESTSSSVSIRLALNTPKSTLS